MPDDTSNPRKSDEIDVLCAANLRRCRLAAKLRISDISAVLGVAPQTLQRLETGEIRVFPGTLYLLSYVYGLPIDDFFAGAFESFTQLPAIRSRHLVPLLKAFAAIESPQLQAMVLDMARALAAPAARRSSNRQ